MICCIINYLVFVQLTELDERMRDLKNELEGYNSEEFDETHNRKALDALKRMENWNLFRGINEVNTNVANLLSSY